MDSVKGATGSTAQQRAPSVEFCLHGKLLDGCDIYLYYNLSFYLIYLIYLSINQVTLSVNAYIYPSMCSAFYYQLACLSH